MSYRHGKLIVFAMLVRFVPAFWKKESVLRPRFLEPRNVVVATDLDGPEFV